MDTLDIQDYDIIDIPDQTELHDVLLDNLIAEFGIDTRDPDDAKELATVSIDIRDLIDASVASNNGNFDQSVINTVVTSLNTKISGAMVSRAQATIDINLGKVYKDPLKEAMSKVLTSITNNFYRTDENKEIEVVFDDGPKATSNKLGGNYYDQQKIVLGTGLMQAFKDLNLPQFMVYYHELGHHLYSQGLFKLNDAWQKIKAPSPIEWKKEYHHLENWIEDYFIEYKMINELPYTKDILTCIKALPPSYDIYDIKYVFNFYYVHGAVSPALSHQDGVVFHTYINKLLQLRGVSSTRFGSGVLSTLVGLTGKKSTETQFVELLIEFYTWCVNKGIFDPSKPPQPALDNPNMHNDLDTGGGSGGSDPNDASGGGGGGSVSPHTRQVGKKTQWTQRTHISTATPTFIDQVAREAEILNKELLDMSQRLQTDNSSLEGLFNTNYHDSTIIQPKVIIPNFFNPIKIAQMELFREKEHAYMNVAIFRDVSGSTEGRIHRVMHQVCEQLYKDIPVDITYYLYASGDISIVEMPYVPWESSSNIPPLYKQNQLFNQLGGGTNSSAIADAITQQLSDKWLNIIVTDGDLHDLMSRDNIYSLLSNVFVIYVGTTDQVDGLYGITIQDTNDIRLINAKLARINGK